MMSKLVVIGGSGFVGRHFLDVIGNLSDFQVEYAIHRTEPDWLRVAPVVRSYFDIDDSASLEAVLTEGCTVINLLRPDGSGWFEQGVANVLRACGNARIKRYIHVSSIDVFGAAPALVVDVHTLIEPKTPYEREHAGAEGQVRGVDKAMFEVLILRLGAIFGEGGLNIISFVSEVSGAPLWRLATRRLLYGQRRMHLVSVEKVAKTLAFMAAVSEVRHGEIVLVTDDAAPENNFGYLQDSMMHAFGRPSLGYLPHLPLSILGLMLQIRGVSNANPMRRFKETRLCELGQPETADFARRLQLYIEHLRKAG